MFKNYEKVFLSECLAISIHSAIFQKQKIDKWQIIWLGRLFLCCFCTAQNEKNYCHTLGTTSALVSVLAEESSSTNSTYASSPKLQRSTQHSSGVSSELQPPDHSYLEIFCSLIYLRKHTKILFKATWYFSK